MKSLMRSISKYYFKILVIHLLILAPCILLFNMSWRYKLAMQEVDKRDNEICRLNTKIKNIEDIKDFFGIGGEGQGIEDNEKDLVKEILNNYSVSKYKWQFEDILPPFDIEKSYITSEYGDKRKTISGKIIEDEHFDVKCINTDDIMAGITGIAIIKYDKIYGNSITIWYDENNYISYAHLNEVYYENLDIVLKGDIIGKQGNTGHCMIRDEKTKQWRDITENERYKGRGKHLDMTIVKDGIHRNGVRTSQQGKFYRDGEL